MQKEESIEKELTEIPDMKIAGMSGYQVWPCCIF